MAPWKYAAAALPLVLWLFGYNPVRLAWAPFSATYYVVTSIPGAIATSVSGMSTGLAPVDSESLRSAIRNVTADPDQMSALIQEYFEDVRRQDPAREQDFRDFLARKAQRSYPTVEIWLDWVLFLYKMALPFLLFFTVIKLTGGRKHQEEALEQFEELGDKATPLDLQ